MRRWSGVERVGGRSPVLAHGFVFGATHCERVLCRGGVSGFETLGSIPVSPTNRDPLESLDTRWCQGVPHRLASHSTNSGIALVSGRAIADTACMDSMSTRDAPQAKELCSFPGCTEQRFAQNKVCIDHYAKLGWALDKSWHDVARWARWAGAVVVVAILLRLFL